jgi:hypothetical protein
LVKKEENGYGTKGWVLGIDQEKMVQMMKPYDFCLNNHGLDSNPGAGVKRLHDYGTRLLNESN